MAARLADAGYARCDLVEGPGQFALRGGILDVFSPGAEQPVRAEFFGDELDALGRFDPNTQRRVENLDDAALLPVAEVLPRLHPGGLEGLAADFTAMANRIRRRKNPHLELLATMQRDLERMQQGLPFAAADRYLRLIYPGAASAASYLPGEALVALCDHGAIRPPAGGHAGAAGAGAGRSAPVRACWPGSWRTFPPIGRNSVELLRGHTCVYLDSFLAARFPEAAAAEADCSASRPGSCRPTAARWRPRRAT